MGARPEHGGPGTLADSTVIVWTSEIGQGYLHSYDNLPWMILGSGQGFFDVGKYVRFGELPVATRRHNRLLVHLGRYMGLELPGGVGHPDYATPDGLPGIAKA